MASPPPPVTHVSRNALVTAAAASVVSGTGIVREMTFASVLGAGLATDAYNAAFRAAQFFREFLAEGSLANLYVPVFAGTWQAEGREAAFRLASAFLGVLLVVLGCVTVGTFVLADGWVWVIASGFAENPDKFALSARLTRVLSPFLALVSLASLSMGMLNVRGRFFLPAVAPASVHLAVIAACLLARPFEAWTGEPAVVAVALGALGGGLGQILVQIPALRREGFRFRPTFRGHPHLKRCLAFLVPAFVGVVSVQVHLAVESQIASRFGDGPVSYLHYAFRLVQLPNSIVAASVGVATLAGLSTLAARGRRDAMSGVLGEALTLDSFLVVPAAVGLWMLADPLVALVYERGAFTADDTIATSALLRMYAIATWGICIQRVLLPAYYAVGRPVFPMTVALATMALKLPVALLLVYPAGLGIAGLPLSHAVLVTVEVAVLLAGLRSRIGALPRVLWAHHLRIGAAAGGMATVLHLLGPVSHGLGLLAVVAGGGFTYVALARLLGVPAAFRLAAHVRNGPGGPPPAP
ncbi:MAG: murein biosynthesis integral membrane protein MurJ [Deltaproteobacteria bacterium]|nr:murein biosynthesis integral membrane protein MurJ [Deltaproteobacteria bacterium]